jgi:hypothetical protein
MDQLLAQEELHITPLGAPFDVEQVGQLILAIPYAWRDEVLPSMYLLFLDEATRDERVARRRADPAARLPYVLLVDVEANKIVVNQYAGPAHNEQSRRFLTELAAQHRCQVVNAMGRDLSAYWPKA